MDRIPNAFDLTAAEFSSLLLVTKGFMSGPIPPAHRSRLIQLGLVQSLMGGLMPTPAGRIVVRG